MLTINDLMPALLAVHDKDYDTPIRGVAKMLRAAEARGLATFRTPITKEFVERSFPVTLTAEGLAEVRAFLRRERDGA